MIEKFPNKPKLFITKKNTEFENNITKEIINECSTKSPNKSSTGFFSLINNKCDSNYDIDEKISDLIENIDKNKNNLQSLNSIETQNKYFNFTINEEEIFNIDEEELSQYNNFPYFQNTDTNYFGLFN